MQSQLSGRPSHGSYAEFWATQHIENKHNNHKKSPKISNILERTVIISQISAHTLKFTVNSTALAAGGLHLTMHLTNGL